LTVVDVSGVHHMWVRWCKLPKCLATSRSHLLQIGLFPVSYKNTKSTFTFRVLDDARMSNLECKSSTYQYYQKLCHATSLMSPMPLRYDHQHFLAIFNDLVYQDHYRELRASWLWQSLKHSKWRGLWVDIPPSGNCMEDAPVTMPVEVGTDIATFCAAYPQPGVNLLVNWGDDPEQWVTSLQINAAYLDFIAS